MEEEVLHLQVVDARGVKWPFYVCFVQQNIVRLSVFIVCYLILSECWTVYLFAVRTITVHCYSGHCVSVLSVSVRTLSVNV